MVHVDPTPFRTDASFLLRLEKKRRREKGRKGEIKILQLFWTQILICEWRLPTNFLYGKITLQ